MSKIKIEYSRSFSKELKRFVKNNRSHFEDYLKAVRLFTKDP